MSDEDKVLMKEIEPSCECPQRPKHTISEVWKQYSECDKNNYFRYEFERKDFDKNELLDLIEILRERLSK